MCRFPHCGSAVGIRGSAVGLLWVSCRDVRAWVYDARSFRSHSERQLRGSAVAIRGSDVGLLPRTSSENEKPAMTLQAKKLCLIFKAVRGSAVGSASVSFSYCKLTAHRLFIAASVRTQIKKGVS